VICTHRFYLFCLSFTVSYTTK